MGLGNNKVDFLADPARLTKWPDLTDAQRKQYTDAVGKQQLDRNGHLLFGAPWEKLAGPGRIKRRFKPWETVVYGW